MNTEPAGATCTVARGGEELAAIAQTPTQVTISKGFRALAVDCKKEGHTDVQMNVRSGFQPITLGNILIGGGIGLIIDAGTGAMAQYPKSVSLSLVPASFTSTKDRDTYFDARVAVVDAETAKAIDEAKSKCQPLACDAAIAALEAERKQRLEALEARRSSVAVRE